MNDDPQVNTGSPDEARCSPELLVDHDTVDDRRIIIADDSGQRVRLSADQLLVLVAAVLSGVLDPIVPSLDLF